MTKAYSYARFSSAEQAKGHSYARQTEAAAKYAADHGLDLDKTLTYLDAGVSAFKSANTAETGKLFEFLQAVQTRVIESGSYLLLESLDRLSRNSIVEAQSLFLSIVSSEITIVTLIDQKAYSKDIINQSPYMMFEPLIVLIRANDESATKSKRILDSWERKRKAAVKSGKPLTRAMPAWLRIDEHGAIVPVPDRAEVVVEIYEKHLAGAGAESIAKDLNERGLDCWGTGKRKAMLWHKSYIQKILCSPAVIGEFTPHTCTKREDGKGSFRTAQAILPHYYPTVIDEETYYQVQEIHKDSKLAGKKRSQDVQSIFARLAVCPHCGAAMTRINKGGRWVYLVCTAAKGGKGCVYHQVPYSAVEETFLAGLRLLRFPKDVKRRSVILDEIAQAQKGIAKYDEQLERIIEAIKEGTVSNDTISHTIEAGYTGDGLPHSYRLADEVRIIEWKRAGLELKIKDLRMLYAAADADKVESQVVALQAAIDSSASKAEINLLLHSIFSRIVVNYDDEVLELHFKHTDRVSTIALPGYKVAVGVVADDLGHARNDGSTGGADAESFMELLF